MSGPSFQLGPNPNRTYLERWNEMHPGRFGRPDSLADTDQGWQQGHSSDDTDTVNIVLSMPPGTDRDKLLDAARQFGREPLATATPTCWFGTMTRTIRIAT